MMSPGRHTHKISHVRARAVRAVRAMCAVSTAEADAVLEQLFPHDHLLVDLVMEARQHHRLQLLLEILQGHKSCVVK
jgi:hypothetical protein